MKTQKIVGACVLIAVLLSGCGSKTAATTDASQVNASDSPSANETTDPAQGKQGGARGAFDPNQMQMFLTFQSLIAMDKTDGLGITKEQADAMVPIVQEGITNKTLTADQQTELEKGLTSDQAQFLADNAAKAKSRFGQGGAGGQGRQRNQNNTADPNGQGDQNAQGDQNGQGDQNAAGDQNGQVDPANSDDQTADSPKPSRRPRPSGGFGGAGGAGGFQNIGQQLLDLLQAKSTAAN